MQIKPKKHGLGLEMKTFQGKGEQSYLVLRTRGGAYHAFLEVEAKQAARECGASRGGNTRQMWEELWNK